MLVVRGKLENRQAIVSIGIKRFRPLAVYDGPSVDALSLPIQAYKALLDTGAQRSCLTHSTISRENLQSHGKRPIRNVHNENLHRLYMLDLGFWCEDDKSCGAQGLSATYFALPEPVEVINIADNDVFDAIIGMDILQTIDFEFSRDGSFCLKLSQ
jgi:hypothetical protein